MSKKKIMFNLRPPEGSFGGGAFFVKNMVKFLEDKGYKIVYSLEPNIDLIFMIDPRKDEYKVNGLDDIMRYRKNNQKCRVLYRVNECDIKREKSINIDPLIVKTIKSVDCVVYITKWLKKYFQDKYPDIIGENKNYVIVNGCNREIFYSNIESKILNIPIKLVTHHWSNNYNKGFEIYNALDKFMETDMRFKNIELTYIGRYNDNYKPKNIKLLSPCQGEKLRNELCKHDIYLTASINEPCGMHFIEGLSCGLPVLYDRRGGGIVETAEKYGEGFSSIEELYEKLLKIINDYNTYRDKIDYEYLGSERCCKEFYEVILDNLSFF